MAQYTALPTRVLSDLEGLRPLLEESIEGTRNLVTVRGLSGAEIEILTDVLGSLKAMSKIINKMRSREWDIMQDAKESTPTG